MTKTIAFLPHNQFHLDLFVAVGKILRKKYGLKVLHIRELGNIKGEQVFQFEEEIEKKWNDIDISYSQLTKLDNKYPDSNLMRAIYSERDYNFFPKYFNDNPIPYQEQLKYLVGCFGVFEEWLEQNNVSCIVSELLIGLSDSVLHAICQKRGIQYISLRSSKLLSGIIMSNQDSDLPVGMIDVYKSFLKNGIPIEYKEQAKSHINELRSKIPTPDYMQASKKQHRLLTKHHLKGAILKLDNNRVPVNTISIKKNPFRTSALWNINRFINIRQRKKNEHRWFCKELSPNEKYFLYPLHYEPEASTFIRAFPFSDQMCVIQNIAKALPLGVILAVKEHRGNQGYRKNYFYRELQYLPNVKLISQEAELNSMIQNSLGIITLTSRMGWEALVLRKPVIAFGSAFWTDFEEVKKPSSWMDLKKMVKECVTNPENNIIPDYDNKLLAYAASYISLIHNGTFVLKAMDFFAEANVENIAKILFLACIHPPPLHKKYC